MPRYLALFACLLISAKALVGQQDAPDLLWITINSVNPEFLSCYGGDVPTPNLDKLAQRGVVFERAYGVSPHNHSGILAQLNSQYPSVMRRMGGTDSAASIGSQLADRGFKSWAYFSKDLTHSNGEIIGRIPYGLQFPRRDWEWGKSESKLFLRIERVLEERKKKQRIFGWVNLSNTDAPAKRHGDIPREPGPEGHYRAALRHVDQLIGRALDTLRENGSLDNTIVVVSGSRGLPSMPTGDPQRHDELTDGTLRIPLLIAGKHIAAGRSAALVSSVDIVPTLLDLLGIPANFNVQGESFGGLLGKESGKGRGFAFAEHLPFDGEAPESRSLSVGGPRLSAQTTTRSP